jgi:nitrate reductase molybdenum cofactor assembly chaperone
LRCTRGAEIAALTDQLTRRKSGTCGLQAQLRGELAGKLFAKLPALVSDPLMAFLDHLEATSLPELAVDFVATFDHRRRCCLYLTYFEHGDTRNRGVALLRFKTAYREAGMLLSDAELPDHLGMLLEFGATADVATARTLLLEHRAGLELLRLALEDAHSSWVHVLRAVSATLPPLAGDDREAVMRLAAQGHRPMRSAWPPSLRRVHARSLWRQGR